MFMEMNRHLHICIKGQEDYFIEDWKCEQIVIALEISTDFHSYCNV